MTIIQIAYEETPAAVERVRTLLDGVAMINPDWNGADFQIESGDFTCIPDRDDADARYLLVCIQSVLSNEAAH